MEAKDMYLVDLIGKEDSIFYIPFYQRKYTWQPKVEIDQLWEDLMIFLDINKEKNNNEYFLGTLIVKKSNEIRSKHTLVDGQQRVTTFLILIAALIECSNKKRDINEYITLCNYINFNNDEAKFKLERINDSNVIQKILKNNIFALSDAEKSLNYYKVYEYFKKEINSKNDLEDNFIKLFLSRCLNKIKIALINLDDSEDEFLIFESINSKGKSLTQGDLIKNYIVSKLENYPEFLRKFENSFIGGFDKYSENEQTFVQFYRQMLAIYDGNLYAFKSKKLYYKFKEMIEEKSKSFTDDNLINVLEEINNDRIIFDYINYHLWDYKFYPLIKANEYNFYSIIHLILKYNGEIKDNKYVPKNNKLIEKAMMFLTKLSIARTLCSFGRVESNKTYAKIAHNLDKSMKETNDFWISFNQEVINKIENSNSNYRMPKWGEISDIEAKKDLYSERKNDLKYILIAIEKYLNNDKKISDENDLNIEHILPQDLKEWQKAINNKITNNYDNWDEIYSWLHTLGNLSIINKKDNSAISNKTFEEKQKILEERSYLKINKFIYEHNEWTVESIKKRAKQILEYIKEIWF